MEVSKAFITITEQCDLGKKLMMAKPKNFIFQRIQIAILFHIALSLAHTKKKKSNKFICCRLIGFYMFTFCVNKVFQKKISSNKLLRVKRMFQTDE